MTQIVLLHIEILYFNNFIRIEVSGVLKQMLLIILDAIADELVCLQPYVQTEPKVLRHYQN